MPGEFSGEVGRQFINDVCRFLDKKFGYKVFETCYMGPEAATIQAGEELVRFDIFMIQEQKESLGNPQIETVIMQYVCECKYRTNPNDLQLQFKDFIRKALKTYPILQRKYSENFCYIFITNRPFGIWDENIESVEFLQEFLEDEIRVDILNYLSSKIGFIVLSDWFLQCAFKGV